MAGMCNALLDEAIAMWHRDSAVTTTAFAVGHSRTLFAQPVSEVGQSQPDESRIGLHALLVGHCDAHTIGRIDEVFFAYGKGGEHDLAVRAETDAEVRTGIAVHAMQTKRPYASIMVLATFTLDHDGKPTWEVITGDDLNHDYHQWFTESIDIARHIKHPLTDQQLHDELEALHWALADSDEITVEDE